MLPEWTWAEVPIYALVPAGRQHIPRVRATIDWLEDYFATAFV